MAARHRRVCYLLRVLRAAAPREWELGLPFPIGAAEPLHGFAC
jgi:hypothetical protein